MSTRTEGASLTDGRHLFALLLFAVVPPDRPAPVSTAGMRPQDPACSEQPRVGTAPTLRFRSAEAVPIKQGGYAVTMWLDGATGSARSVSGRMDLAPAAPRAQRSPNARAVQLLQGRTDIPLHRFGVATAGNAADAGASGVTLSFDPGEMRAAVVIGSTWSADKPPPESQGAVLDLAIADSTGFRGRWQAQGGGAKVLRGSFCVVLVRRAAGRP